MFIIRRPAQFVFQNLRIIVPLLFVVLVAVFAYNSQRIVLESLSLSVQSPNRLVWQHTITDEGAAVFQHDRSPLKFWPGTGSYMGIVIRSGNCPQESCTLDEILETELAQYARPEDEVVGNVTRLFDLAPADATPPPGCNDAVAASFSLRPLFSPVTKAMAFECDGKQFVVTGFQPVPAARRDCIFERFVQSIQIVE